MEPPNSGIKTMVPPAIMGHEQLEDSVPLKEVWRGIFAVQMESADTIAFLTRVCSYPHQTESIENGKKLLAERIEERLGQHFAALAWFIKENRLDAQRIEQLRDRGFIRYDDNPPPGMPVDYPSES